MENVNADFEVTANKAGKRIQKLVLLNENDQLTRDYYLSVDNAIEQLENQFDFREGKKYIIPYLTNYGWRSGQVFEYRRRRTDLSECVYNTDREQMLYGDQALDKEDLHIYAIVVQEM
jgi:hypothetical protein